MVLKPGDILIREGEQSNQLYWIMHGELKAFKTINGLEVELNRLKEGDLVGELSFLDQRPRSATIKAVKETQLLVLEYEDYQQMLKDQPKWMKKILFTLTTKIRKLSEL